MSCSNKAEPMRRDAATIVPLVCCSIIDPYVHQWHRVLVLVFGLTTHDVKQTIQNCDCLISSGQGHALANTPAITWSGRIQHLQVTHG